MSNDNNGERQQKVSQPPIILHIPVKISFFFFSLCKKELPTLEQHPPNINEKMIVHGTKAGSASRITSLAEDPRAFPANKLPLPSGSRPPLPSRPGEEEAAAFSRWRSVMRSAGMLGSAVVVVVAVDLSMLLRRRRWASSDEDIDISIMLARFKP